MASSTPATVALGAWSPPTASRTILVKASVLLRWDRGAVAALAVTGFGREHLPAAVVAAVLADRMGTDHAAAVGALHELGTFQHQVHAAVTAAGTAQASFRIGHGGRLRPRRGRWLGRELKARSLRPCRCKSTTAADRSAHAGR